MKALRTFISLAVMLALAIATGCGGSDADSVELAPIVRGVTAETRSASVPGARSIESPAADQMWVIPIYIDRGWPGGIALDSLWEAVPVAIGTDGSFAYTYGVDAALAERSGVTHIPEFGQSSDADVTFTGQVVMMLVDSTILMDSAGNLRDLETRKGAFLGFVSLPDANDAATLVGMPVARLRGNSDVALGTIAAPAAAGALERRSQHDIADVATHFEIEASELAQLAYTDDMLLGLLNYILNGAYKPDLTNHRLTHTDSDVWYHPTMEYAWKFENAFDTEQTVNGSASTYALKYRNSAGNFYWAPGDSATGFGPTKMAYQGFTFFVHSSETFTANGNNLSIKPSVAVTDGTFDWNANTTFRNDGSAAGVPSGAVDTTTTSAVTDTDISTYNGTTAVGTAHWCLGNKTSVNFADGFMATWGKPYLKPGTAATPGTTAVTTGWWDVLVSGTTQAAFNLNFFDPYGGQNPATATTVKGLVPGLEIVLADETMSVTRTPYYPDLGSGPTYSLPVKKVQSFKVSWWYHDGTAYRQADDAMVESLVSRARITIGLVKRSGAQVPLQFALLGGLDGITSSDGVVAPVASDGVITVTPTQGTILNSYKYIYNDPYHDWYYMMRDGGVAGEVGTAENPVYSVREVTIDYLINGASMRFTFTAYVPLT